ncbi:AMP-binding protein [Streptomyces sp. LX-29]|uniref:AMP-binding protein n=1 Tax=Streptomyces sp. LX-29 TaxID=2900152 RepID=UPI00240CE960|nr:AMP-binding protein [Streptomyces sp. LX-29]WFB09334.1 AMP-binding protein [Streptomyces sp. LX-29]
MLLNWLEDPSPTRGIRFAAPGQGWLFRSYADLAAESLAVAAALRDHLGPPPAAGVVNLLTADPRRFVTGFFGVLLAGCTPSPIAPATAFRDRSGHPDHVTGILRTARPVAVLTDEKAYATAAAAATAAGLAGRVLTHPVGDAGAVPEPARGTGGPVGPGAHRAAPPRDALLQFTSGSSGNPKGVRVSWENLRANVAAIRRWLDWSDQDAFASWLPLHHDMGLIGAMITPVVSGTDLWLMTPEQFLRSPRRWLECFGAHGATLTTAPGFGYGYAARRVTPEEIADLDFGGWRVAILGAERIDPAAAADFTALTAPRGFRHTSLVPAYGLAEATLAATGTTPGTPAPLIDVGPRPPRVGDPVEVLGRGVLGVDRAGGAGWLTGCGAPVPGLTVRVVDEDGAALPDGRFGEIELRGDSVARGHVTADGLPPAAPGATAFVPDPVDGAPDVLRTGDCGLLLDGQLYVLGRIGDSLKVRGRSLYAEDLEAELASAFGPRAGRCTAVLGAASGQDLALVLLEGPPADAADDPDLVREVLAKVRAVTSERVRTVVLRGGRGSVPRTSSGKPRRRAVWDRLVDSAGGSDDWELIGDSGPPGDDGTPVRPWVRQRGEAARAEPSPDAPTQPSPDVPAGAVARAEPSHADAPVPAARAEHTEAPGADRAGARRTERGETPRTEHAEAPRAERADRPGAEPLDASEEPAGRRPARLPTSRELYDRWERQQWSVREVAVERDAETWGGLRPFARQELLSALAELEVGEVCVTQTLSSLVDGAPTEDDRIYLCTQLADEGRHVRFFQDYLECAAGVDLAAPADGGALELAAAYGRLFEPELRRATAAARDAADGGHDAWYRALTYYHLITEGVLATTTLRTTRALARRFGLHALDDGLTHVTRDESRHVAFGLAAARAGVRGGYRDAVAESYLSGVELAARVMVAPDRRAVSPRLRPALVTRAEQLSGHWELARDRMLRQLGQIGLGELRGVAGRSWDGGRERALDEYRERWGVDHPVRLAAGGATTGGATGGGATGGGPARAATAPAPSSAGAGAPGSSEETPAGRGPSA